MSGGRANRWGEIENSGAFDAVVIGGGVNGIGVFRDLSLQGLRVLLVERNDFCSGCSAAPSRMIHGGLRYLENGEFDLVRESLRERDALLQNAPHMVRPLPTIIPIASLFSGLMNSAASFFGWRGKPSARGFVPIKLGLSLYDWVTRNRKILPTHKTFGRRRTRKDWPSLTKAARYSALYHDAWISHPERLCVEMLRDTEPLAPNCIALNYAELSVDGGGHVLTDLRNRRQLPITARIIVNATGAWLDDVAQGLRGTVNERMVSGTKGSHLIIDNDALFAALDGHMVYFENADGRVCIVFPYLGKVLAGSTDIRVTKASRVKCEPEELAYILGSLRLVFEDIEIDPSEVIFSYSGIRPLPLSSADFTGRISRGHFTRRLSGPVPQLCMIGGKWTTFRAFAEQTADEVLAELGCQRKRSTLDLAIGGGAAFPANAASLEASLASEFSISAERATHIANHYGTDGRVVLRFCQARDDDKPIGAGTDYTAAEIAYLAQYEYAETVSDIVLRRTSLAIRGLLDAEIIDAVCGIFGRERALSPEEMAKQREALVEDLTIYHGVADERLAGSDKNWSMECA